MQRLFNPIDGDTRQGKALAFIKADPNFTTDLRALATSDNTKPVIILTPHLVSANKINVFFCDLSFIFKNGKAIGNWITTKRVIDVDVTGAINLQDERGIKVNESLDTYVFNTLARDLIKEIKQSKIYEAPRIEGRDMVFPRNSVWIKGMDLRLSSSGKISYEKTDEFTKKKMVSHLDENCADPEEKIFYEQKIKPYYEEGFARNFLLR